MRLLCLVGTTLALALSAGFCQEDGVLYSKGFEEGLGTFTTLDPDAELVVTTAADAVYSGEQSLELWFVQRAMAPDKPDQGIPGSLSVQTPEGLAGLQSMSFAVAVAQSTAVAVILSEGEDGPRYNRIVWVEAGKWHEVSLQVGEFQRDINGAADPDGKLTPEKIDGVALIDLAVFFRSMAQGNPIFFIPPLMEQTIWLDEVKLFSKLPEEQPTADRIVVSDYSLPLRGVAFIGGESVAVTAETNPQGEEETKLEYSVPAQTLMAAVHQVCEPLPPDAQTLTLRLKSPEGATLLVNLEEQSAAGDENKCSYNSTRTIPASPDWQLLTFPLAEFTIGDDGIDPNGKLDPEHVQTVMIADIRSLTEQKDIKAVLYLDELAVTK
jgi:hypothetical protein